MVLTKTLVRGQVEGVESKSQVPGGEEEAEADVLQLGRRKKRRKEGRTCHPLQIQMGENGLSL